MSTTAVTRHDFISQTDAEFLSWHDNFTAQILLYQDILELPRDRAVEIEVDNCFMHETVRMAGRANQRSQDAAREKEATRRAVEAGARVLAREIRAQPGYTEAIGRRLGIDGIGVSRLLGQARPVLAPSCQKYGVVLRFNQDRADAINLYSRRADETYFTFLARDTNSPYIDTRGCVADAPEEREYYGVYVEGADEVGFSSDLVRVIFRP